MLREVESKMGITKYLLMNAGYVARVSSVSYQEGNLPYNTYLLPDHANRDWCYDPGVDGAASALNLAASWDACSALPATSDALFTYIIDLYEAETFNSTAFKAAVNSFFNSCIFIFGDRDKGGWGFVHIDGGIGTFWYQGTISQEVGGVVKYAYAISRGLVSHGGYIPRNYVEDCALTLVDEGLNKKPELILWCSNRTYAGKNKYFQLNAIGLTWTAVDEDLASVYTSDSTYSSATGVEPFPWKPWFIDNAYSSTRTTYLNSEFIEDLAWGDAEVDIENLPDYDGGNSEQQGGYGGYPSDSVPNDFEDLDDIDEDGISSGFVTLYNPTRQQIIDFNNWLWTDITDSLSQQIKRLMVNPMEAVLFIALAHITPPRTENTSEIKFCGINTLVYAKKLTKRFVQYDCGSLKVEGDTLTFLDFQPYSKCEIYLPAIGYKELDVNDVIGSEITLKYSVDWLSGSCLAQLRMNRKTRRSKGDAELDHNILYEFQGNIYTYLPISASDWKSFYSNVISGIGGMAAMVSGSPQAIVSGVANIANSVMSQQVNVQKSGSVSSSFGYMGQQSISLFITRPILAEPTNFALFNGYQSNIYYKVGNLEGYTEINPDSLWIDEKDDASFRGITEEEAKLIKDICNKGVYL